MPVQHLGIIPGKRDPLADLLQGLNTGISQGMDWMHTQKQLGLQEEQLNWQREQAEKEWLHLSSEDRLKRLTSLHQMAQLNPDAADMLLEHLVSKEDAFVQDALDMGFITKDSLARQGFPDFLPESQEPMYKWTNLGTAGIDWLIQKDGNNLILIDPNNPDNVHRKQISEDTEYKYFQDGLYVTAVDPKTNEQEASFTISNPKSIIKDTKVDNNTIVYEITPDGQVNTLKTFVGSPVTDYEDTQEYKHWKMKDDYFKAAWNRAGVELFGHEVWADPDFFRAMSEEQRTRFRDQLEHDLKLATYPNGTRMWTDEEAITRARTGTIRQTETHETVLNLIKRAEQADAHERHLIAMRIEENPEYAEVAKTLGYWDHETNKFTLQPAAWEEVYDTMIEGIKNPEEFLEKIPSDIQDKMFDMYGGSRGNLEDLWEGIQGAGKTITDVLENLFKGVRLKESVPTTSPKQESTEAQPKATWDNSLLTPLINQGVEEVREFSKENPNYISSLKMKFKKDKTYDGPINEEWTEEFEYALRLLIKQDLERR